MTKTPIWHPHQGVWNSDMTRRLSHFPSAVARTTLAAIVGLDSLILLGRALFLFLRSPRTSGIRARVPVLYIDCGVHRDGSELRLIHSWLSAKYDLSVLGFEASPQHFQQASSALRLPGIDLRQVAVVGPDHHSPSVQLFRAGDDGRGDSLFAERGVDFDTVPAVRLSQVLAGKVHSLKSCVVILRMNIEGSEAGVIDDLEQAGIVSDVDGFFGMWDDLGKIDPDRDVAFRKTLRRNSVRPFTFNERDLRIPPRRWAIRLALTACIRTGVARKHLETSSGEHLRSGTEC